MSFLIRWPTGHILKCRVSFKVILFFSKYQTGRFISNMHSTPLTFSHSLALPSLSLNARFPRPSSVRTYIPSNLAFRIIKFPNQTSSKSSVPNCYLERERCKRKKKNENVNLVSKQACASMISVNKILRGFANTVKVFIFCAARHFAVCILFFVRQMFTQVVNFPVYRIS